MTVRVTVWGEFRQDRSDAAVQAIYPDGIHGAIAAGLREHDGFEVRTATLDEPDQGLSDAVLAETDVLTWWGHVAHDEVSDATVDRVHARVLDGMGLIVLHSGHFSKIFKRLMGTSCDLKWREDGRRERLWVVDPSHPIAEGIGESFVLAEEEMYGEHFDIPPPDELVFVSWFEGGEVFRSGCMLPSRPGPRLLLPPGPRDPPDLPRRHRPPGDRQRGALGRRTQGRPPDVRQRATVGAARLARRTDPESRRRPGDRGAFVVSARIPAAIRPGSPNGWRRGRRPARGDEPRHDVHERGRAVDDAEEDDRVRVADADPVQRVASATG